MTEYYYDALSRLKTAVLPGDITQDYEFDDLGNISCMTEISGSNITETQYYYDRNSRLLLKECQREGTLSRYAYDNNGNLILSEEVTVFEGGTDVNTYTYLFNGFNQLETVIDPYGDIYGYTYDTSGLRTGKTTPDGAISFLNENGKILIESDGEGFITAKNVWGIQLLERQTEEAVYGYLYNGHGDIIALTDKYGSVLEDYSYDPYGNDLPVDIEEAAVWVRQAENEERDNPFRYCGEYLDNETGLYYLRARYYDPETGRFLSEDTNWNPNNMICGDDPGDNDTPNIAAIIQSSNL